MTGCLVPRVSHSSPTLTSDRPWLTIVREERFLRTPDGRIWSRWGTGPEVWLQYRSVFGGIRVVARIESVSRAQKGWTNSDAPNVLFHEVPYFHGPFQYARKAHRVNRFLAHVADTSDTLIVRVPSPLANPLVPKLVARRRVFGIEVAGDPADMFQPGAVRHPMRPFFRWWFSTHLRYQCRHARAARYVTQSALQRRYPPGPQTLAYGVSDVCLPDDAYVTKRRPAVAAATPTVVTVSMLEQFYKGSDILLQACGICEKLGFPISLTIIGDGRLRPKLESMADAMGIRTLVSFRGVMSRQQIRAELDRADLFVLPSKQEGLPRALLEAMARGVPCVASSIGGIVELLPASFLVPPGDADLLAHTIIRVLRDEALLEAASKENLRVAKLYHDDLRSSTFVAFLRDLAKQTRLAQ